MYYKYYYITWIYSNKNLKFDYGPVPTASKQKDAVFSIYLDGELHDSMTIKPTDDIKSYNLDVNGVNQLSFSVNYVFNSPPTGLGNMIIE